MTGITVVGTAGIVRPATASEGCGGMTGGTVQAGRNMRRHGIHHARRRIAVMARSTIVCDTGMVERCRDKAGGVMAYAAILIGWYVTVALTCRKACAMTRCTIVHDADMVKRRGQKTRRDMAVAAVIVGRHMIVGFASGGGAVVT